MAPRTEKALGTDRFVAEIKAHKCEVCGSIFERPRDARECAAEGVNDLVRAATVLSADCTRPFTVHRLARQTRGEGCKVAAARKVASALTSAGMLRRLKNGRY